MYRKNHHNQTSRDQETDLASQAQLENIEFWIYSVYGKFYLKVVSNASLAVGAENPRIFSFVYPP
jgi:hypothetical protein